MPYQAKRPEDILPDNTNFVERNGMRIRKGTIAAALANADILQADDASAEEKQRALEAIKLLLPSLKAMRLMKHMTWKNPDIQKLFED